MKHRGHGQAPRLRTHAKSTLSHIHSVNTNSRHMQTVDLLLRVISHICKESGEYTADNLVSKADKNALLVCLHKVRGAEDQQPKCLNKLPFAVCDCCL